MSDWGWITFGYTVVYGGIAAYAAFLTGRYRKARRRLDGLD
jgi:CcmD family protein